MSEGNGKNPVTSVFGSIGGMIMLAFIVMGTLAFIFGVVTGRKPERGNLTSVTDVLSWLGALTNTATRSTVDTFAPDLYNKTNTIDGSAEPRLIQQPQRLTPDAVPTSAKAKSNQANNAAVIADQAETYDVDLNGNPIAPLTTTKKK